MKKFIRIPQIFGAVLLLSCTTDVIPPQAEPVKVVVSPETPPVLPVVTPTPILDGVARMYQAFALTGQTSVIPKADFIIPTPSQKAELSALKTAGSTGELNYIAIGGSITAGYRDQGLTRASQLTAYPNLIAHQMGLVNFKSPLFEVAEANGSGGLVFDGTAEVPSWKQVTNQTALKSNAPMLMSKYNGGDFQNISVPFSGKGLIGTPIRIDLQNIKPYSFIERLVEKSNITNTLPTLYDVMIKKQKADLCTVEFGFDNYIDYIMTQKNLNFEGFTLGDYSVSFDEKGNVLGKPVWLLMPSQILRLPYFQFFTYEKLIKQLGVSEIMIESGNGNYIEKADKNCVFIPTQRILDAIKNKTPLGVVPDVEVMDALECQGARTSKGLYSYNGIIENAAKEKNVPLVDLPAVYEKVLNGTYVSEDGFKIDPSFPKGNFFSQDGIYPSAIGQAVIANEVIKVMNRAYKTNIPLINLTQYARNLSK